MEINSMMLLTFVHCSEGAYSKAYDSKAKSTKERPGFDFSEGRNQQAMN